jgi:hypothetical protein
MKINLENRAKEDTFALPLRKDIDAGREGIKVF